MAQKNHNWIITGIIALMAIIVFINLGTGEIQPWDEGLYAIRAKSILHYDDFWDQTEYSSGGLYSSTYPPLTIWFMSGAMKLFGENEFSARFFSALCSIFSLIFIYLISKKVVSFKYSVLTIILTGTTIVWNKFSREGMTD
ncbi:MAG: glycosyltransferase family 39 protein, partial [Ignavibacteriae bacterium]|nr:glycosyltransferase family 39 protein [Ignavibacteriota bacterium]